MNNHTIAEISSKPKELDSLNFLSDRSGSVVQFGEQPGKTSFLVFKNHKYFTVPTQHIAFFCLKYHSANMVCFDQREYLIDHSLEKIQNMVTARQFFRLNRQYLINFNAVKEVEHYFARKLLVHLTVPVSEKLLVTKDKTTLFLEWMESR